METNQQTVIENIALYLKKRYEKDSSGHDWLHLKRVWEMAKRLAVGENVDHFVVELAALLHDVDDYKFKKPGEDEAGNVKKILGRFRINESTNQQIIDIATHVSYKGAGVPDIQPTIEGQIVQDSDRLDVLGAIGIARVFAYGGWAGHKMYDPEVQPVLHTTFEQYQADSPSINHFYEKLLLLKDRLHTPQAKKIAEHRHKFLEKFLKEFWAEIEGMK